MFLSYDERLYGREEGGGLLVGFFDENAVPLSPDRLPPDFEFSLMPPNWDQITANLEIATHRFPVLADAEIRIQYNGPESFTPDVKMLLGETPEVAGLFVSAGLNSSGIALAAGAGRLTAEWVLDGYPSLDASRLDIQRFAPEQGDLAYRRARASEAVTFMCRRPGPGIGFESARDQQVSPLHELLVEAGAQMGPAQTWERPLWFGDRHSAAESVTAEVHAARNGVALTDRSSDTKLRVTGDGVEGRLDWGSGAFPVGTARLVVLSDPGRTSKAMPWVARVGVDEWLFVVEADQATRLKVWLHNHLPTAMVFDETASWGAVSMRGPGSQELLARVIDDEIPGVGVVRQLREQGITGWVLHVDPGPSFVTLVPAAATVAWYAALLAAGADLGARPAGYWADEEAWVSAGIPRFGRESSPTSATRLGAPSDGDAPVGGERPPTGAMSTFRVDGVDFVAAEGAPLVSNGVTVGYVTTAVPDGTGTCLLRGVGPFSEQPVYAVIDGHDHLLQPLEAATG
jgi:glycine cleavage system aminomethyltransferase T